MIQKHIVPPARCRQKIIQQEFASVGIGIRDGRAGVSAHSRVLPLKKVLKTKAFATLLA
jgi:hypothetical protein